MFSTKSYTNFPEELNLNADSADFLRIHLPDRIKDEHDKPIESVICSVKKTNGGYTCDIESSSFSQNTEYLNINEVIPEDIVTFNEVGCDFDIKHLVEVFDVEFINYADNEVRICDKEKKVLAAFISNVQGKFAIHGSDLPSDSLDLPNSIFHFNYKQHKELIKDEVKIIFHLMPEDIDFKI